MGVVKAVPRLDLRRVLRKSRIEIRLHIFIVRVQGA